MQIRATNPEDKELRREAILDAAEQLWLTHPERLCNVADIATAAGLAKGTVYLYFRSKEELFLGIHERHVGTFFSRMKTRAQQATPMTLDDLFSVNRQFLLDFPAFLPLATLCHGLLERQIPLDIAFAFEQRTYTKLNEVVEVLRNHFPQTTQALMLQSYALFLGLWQLMRPTPLKELMKERSLLCACTDDYLQMLESALTSLWRGALTPEIH
ncbi:TetR/AcrR family transcriptional regulator [Thiothrix winogradskyi]|uniref:TetR/AcrR family transcriptional regulator n=1 Tax=Thiothrix winogradskyi TaxID=96472 RepID=A0ABY3SZU9_9GAMM|nr:TetR/AcrR family transcriptional regulator [Thiothrix winogradskyi]UJS24099.1 TetR/AcrR family transcriptional regulator [Thiothrix winogradskyi]